VRAHSAADSGSFDARRREKMKGLVYGGAGQRTWTDVPDAHVRDPRDAVIRIDAVTICGTDLHILAGDVPEVTPGRVLGHEAVGTVWQLPVLPGG
jgi:alcohol dehydrogenase